MDRRLQWVGFCTALLFIVIAGLLWLPSRPVADSPEQQSYLATVRTMQAGEGYYSAMTASLPDAPTQVRSIREPTMFLVWRYTGLSWPLALAVICLSGVLLSLCTNPLIGAAGTIWLVLAAHSLVNAMWTEVEFWALPLVLAAMLAIRRDRWTLAACLLLAGALIRELVAPCLILGCVAAWQSQKPLRPWMAAVAAWCVFYAIHTRMAAPYLSAAGSEFPLAGTSALRGVLAMASINLGLVGLAIVICALWVARFRPEWWIALPLVVGIPVVGLTIYRLYWAVLVFPVALALLGPALGDKDAAARSDQSATRRRFIRRTRTEQA
jgi:hypothetical protein